MAHDFKIAHPVEKFYGGSRIGVMLIHGLTGTPTEMTSIGKLLHEQGFSVYCPLLPGHCVSEEELKKTSYHDWIAGARESLDRFSQHMDVVFTGGLSIGATLSVKLAALEAAKIRGQALYSITLEYDGWTIPKLRFLLPLVLHIPFVGQRYSFKEAWPYGLKNERLRKLIHAAMESGDSVAAGFRGMPGLSLREFWRLAAEVKADMPQIKTPTIVLHSYHDDIASKESNAFYVRDNLGAAPRVRILENSYHIITIDQERKVVADETVEYFRGCLSEEEIVELERCSSKARG